MAINNTLLVDKIHANGSSDYQNRIPQASKNGIAATMNALFDPANRNLWNEFEVGLINHIGNQIVTDFEWENPLAPFKQESILPHGSTIQEIALDMIEARGYNYRDNNIFKNNPSEVYSAFHTVNRQDRYDLTLNEEEMKKAFTSEYGLNEFINRKLAKPGQSAAYDEYNIMINLIAEANNKFGIFNEQVIFANAAVPTEAELKSLSVKIRSTAKKMVNVPKPLYNAAGVPTVSRKEDLVLITTPEIEANLDVNVLADSFNIDRADFASRVVLIDEFPLPDVYALLVDKAWFVCGDTVNRMENFFNPMSLTQNYYLHRWGVYSVSPFANAVMFSANADTNVEVIDVELTGIEGEFQINGEAVTNFVYGDDTKLVVTGVGTIDPEHDGVILPDSYTTEISLEDEAGNGINKKSRTYLTRNGELKVQSGLEDGSVITVDITSAYVNPSGTTTEFTDQVTLTVGE